MSAELITVMMFISMIALLITGREIFLIVGAVGTVSALALWGPGGMDMVFFNTFGMTNWYVLLAFPPFLFMGYILARSGVADSLFNAIYLWTGRIRGGLGIGTVGVCSLIAAMSGSNIAGTVTAATVALPAMLKRKYDKLMVTGLVQAGGGLAVLIPPSIVFILYGMIARVSIGHLWIAGIVPGFLLASMYITYIGVRCKIQPHLGPALPPEERVSWGEKFRALRTGILPIILIFAVLGLLFMGVTTLIECAVIGAIGALACAAIHRKLNWGLFKEAMSRTGQVTVIIIWILTAAFLFSSVYDGLGATEAIEHLLVGLAGGRGLAVIGMMMLTWIGLGTIMDDSAMLIITAPLFVPIASHLGFNLVWFGVLYVITVLMALLTPPFGFSLFVMKGIIPTIAPDSGITMRDIYRSVFPFVGIQALCLGILMAFPQIALWLPNVVFGG